MITGQAEPENYVDLIQDNQIRVEHVTSRLRAELINLGAFRQNSNSEAIWLLSFENEVQLAALLSRLRDLGVLFVGGPAGWPPAEVFAHLREKGAIGGEFPELTWYRPNKWLVRTR